MFSETNFRFVTSVDLKTRTNCPYAEVFFPSPVFGAGRGGACTPASAATRSGTARATPSPWISSVRQSRTTFPQLGATDVLNKEGGCTDILTDRQRRTEKERQYENKNIIYNYHCNRNNHNKK